MEQNICGRENCTEKAVKYCFDCRAMLCSSHRIDDVKKNRSLGSPEHLHVDALEYNMNPEHYTEYYCEMHHEILIGRCINCGIFSCNECTPEICPKGSGRNHDYNPIRGYAAKYNATILELEKLLHKKNAILKVKLKEPCRNLGKMESNLKQLIDKVDEEVERQIAALRDDGEKFKNEIYNKKIELSKMISQQIEDQEQKEMESRNLIASIRACVTDISCIKLVKNYSRIQEETEVLLQDRVLFSQPPVYDIQLRSAGAEQSQPLQLELRQTSPGVEEECKEILCPKQKEATINYLTTRRADRQQNYRTYNDEILLLTGEQRFYYRVSYRPTGIQDTAAGSTVIAGSWSYTERVQGGKSTDRKRHETEVLQLLPFEDDMLLLTRQLDTDTYRYTVRGLDSGHVFYSYTDDKIKYYSTYSYKQIAVTSTRQLLVLHMETKTLRVVSLEAGGETEHGLSDAGIEGAHGILVTSSGGLIISLGRLDGETLVHYNPQTRQVLWQSKPLSDRRMWFTEHQESVYVIRHKNPIDVCRLSLSDSTVIQMIQCSNLPKYVYDMSMRGDTFVVAGSRGNKEGISYFQIIDAMN